MICVSIQNKNFGEISEILGRVEMAELRLDRCGLSLEEIDEIFCSDIPLVATCRVSDLMAADPGLTEAKAASISERRLVAAIESGAKYVDVEYEMPKHVSKSIRGAAHENGSIFIRSFHDFHGTPSDEELQALVERGYRQGADTVKIVTTARSVEDVQRVLALYDKLPEGRKADSLIAFCMCPPESEATPEIIEAARMSRLECLKKGSPYTYAALTSDEAAAPGQWACDRMHEAVYGKFRFVGDGKAALPMPCSKSFAQRAIIAAALAEGESVLDGYSPCGDNESAIQVAENMGAAVRREASERGGEKLYIKGIAAGCQTLSLDGLHVGESGLLTRIMTPLLAQISSSEVLVTGEKTLSTRPLSGVPEMMARFGASVRPAEGESPARIADSITVPFRVKGPLKPGKTEISGKQGSQLISGLLMSLPLGKKSATLSVVEPKSLPYMFITLDVLKKFGIHIGNEMLGGDDFLESGGDWSLCNQMIFKIKPGYSYKSAKLYLEADWSAAANFLVAGAVFGKVTLSGLDTASLQADLSIMDILMDAGASITREGGRYGDLTIQRAPLSAFEVDANHCPDLFPIIAVLASFCEGTSRICGVKRLAHKESNRAEAIVEMLTKMGVEVSVEDDLMQIRGYGLTRRILTGKLLKGGEFTSHHDHRMAMALKVASLGASSPVIIDDEKCTAKSFPDFCSLWEGYISEN